MSVYYLQLFIIYLTLHLHIGLASVKILNLDVPPIADLQEEELKLDCKYDMGKEELYSIKWYKDEQEFFRYVPQGVGEQSFAVSGVNVHPEKSPGDLCDVKHCPVILTNLSRSSEGCYKCEISTEAPTFKVFAEAANMSIIALPRGNVVIATARTEYSDGDDIFVNCTAPRADPAPKMRWYMNDRLMSAGNIISQSDSVADERGLVTRSLAAHLPATKDLFLHNNNLLALRCEVNAPQQLPLHATVYMTMYELKQQKFDWLSSVGSTAASSVYLFICTLIISLYTL